MSSERDSFAKGIFSTFAKGFLLYKLLLKVNYSPLRVKKIPLTWHRPLSPLKCWANWSKNCSKNCWESMKGDNEKDQNFLMTWATCRILAKLYGCNMICAEPVIASLDDDVRVMCREVRWQAASSRPKGHLWGQQSIIIKLPLPRAIWWPSCTKIAQLGHFFWEMSSQIYS
jgi:hypothetical protein